MTSSKSEYEQKIESAIRRLIVECINDRTLVFDDDVIDEIIRELDIDELSHRQVSKDILERVNYVTIFDSGDVWAYVLLPKEVKLSEDVSLLLKIIYKRLLYEYSREEADSAISKIVADFIYEKFADSVEFGDPLAWLMLKVAKSYEIEPDKIVDRTNRQDYTGDVYYRFGNTWIRVSYYYCNYTRHGDYVGVQKCIHYSFSPEPT